MAKWIEREVRYAHYIAEGMGRDGRGLLCAVCLTELKAGAHTIDPACASLDHQDPRANTGRVYDRTPTNLICLCGRCNSSKKDQHLDAFLGKLPADVATRARVEIARRTAIKAEGMGSWIAESRARGFGKKKGK